MSLPKHTTSTPLSSSPSKQSIRRATESNDPSRPESTNDRPTTAQQTHPFSQEQQSYEPVPNVTSLYSENERPHEIFTSHPPFQPFFTLIEDTNTSEYYHPTVHYIFSDDDTEIVTEAAFRSLEPEQDMLPHGGKGNSRSTRNQHLQEQGGGEEEVELSSERKEPLLPPPIPGVRDNYIILDMDMLAPADMQYTNTVPGHDVIIGSPGTQSAVPQQQQDSHNHNQQSQKFAVTSAYSLTPTWQVLNTQLAPAPTFENSPSGEHPPNGALMLKIQGTHPEIRGYDGAVFETFRRAPTSH
ncbi:hypothetical protein BDV26DRAFT_50499 [Aspergillus bertholletiae]|uniref:Uncharacterized protein n=1 Tax=Aspergillus bertholletiae TaxID=1226010 RepID=A0A5N7AWL9_9EURO|nr:hypothetical protein BDV26DRAFT_50499 [Aspergillus bertholletiae]